MSLSSILKERGKVAEQKRQKAVAEAQGLARLLRERFSFESIYLIGSALGSRFNERSDLDFVIRGLKSIEFFKVHAFLLKESSRDVDIKPFEDLDEYTRTKVLSEGIKLG
jgi:predicted nucleotidyltransferase